MLDATNESYRAANTIGQANIQLQLGLLAFNPANFMSRTNPVSSNRGVAFIPRTPVGEGINIGGKYETPGITNVNNLTDMKSGAGIPNWVNADAQNIGGTFQASSARTIVSSEFPINGVRDWNMFGRGASGVLTPGGTVNLNLRMGGPAYPIGSVTTGLRNAGFTQIRATPLGNPRSAAVYNIFAIKPF